MDKYYREEVKIYIEDKKKKAMNDYGLKAINERDFVEDIRDYYFDTDIEKVLVLSGLRATGKTFGLFQAVEKYDDVLYLTSTSEEPETGKDYIETIKSYPATYIIIDEYSWIKDRSELDKYLYTLVSGNDRKRVAITGTDSIALDYMPYSDLIHRVLYTNVNMVTFQEYCRIYQKEYCKKTCEEYLQIGGVFSEYAIETFDDMLNYIQLAVIDNLANYTKMDKEKAKAIIYDIIYLAVCPSSETKVEYPNSRKQDVKYQAMLDRIGISPDVMFDKFDFKRVSDILIKTGFVVKTYNIADETGESYRLHLTNPSLTYQMTEVVFDDISASNRLGKAFEASVVSYMSRIIRSEDNMYYIDLGEKLGKPELEIVIIDSDNHLAYLMDAKLEGNAKLPPNKSLVSSLIEDSLGGICVAGRYVICNSEYETAREVNGKPVIFTNIESTTLLNYNTFTQNFDDINNAKNSKRYRTPKKDDADAGLGKAD